MLGNEARKVFMQQGLAIEADHSVDSDPTKYSRLPLGNMPESFKDNSWKKVKWNFNLLHPQVQNESNAKFSFCKGDLVVMGGYYGSHLKDEEGELGWLSMDIVLGLKKCTLTTEKEWEPNGVLDRIGPLDVCSGLIKELTSYAENSNGSFRLHQYAYDWRLSGQVMTKNMIQYLEKIYSDNGNEKVVIIAHSMGGMIALSTAQQKPELVKGIVFCGTPFGLGGVPLVLWGIQKGAPLSRAFSPELHFGSPSSFLFLPKDGKALVDSKNEDILIDFFNSDEWLENRISKIIPSNKSKLDYLKNSLKDAKEFSDSLARSPLSNNVFVVVTSDSWPTPTRLKAHYKTHRSKSRHSHDHPCTSQTELRISSPCNFAPGDGVVSKDTAMMPLGYDYHVLYTKYSHIGMMNDLETIEKALVFIYGNTLSSS